MKRRRSPRHRGLVVGRAAVIAIVVLVLTTCNQNLLRYLIENGGVSDQELPRLYLYLELGDGLRSAELFDPEAPRVVGELPQRTVTRDLALVGTYGYVADLDEIHVLDLSKPWDIRRLQSVPVDGFASLAVSGSWAYTYQAFGAGNPNSTVGIYSLASPDSPQLDEIVDLGHVSDEGTIHSTDDSDWIFVVSGQEFMIISDPGVDMGAASIAGSVATSKADSILDRGDHVYVAGNDGIDVIDISDFANPTIVQTVDLPGATQMAWMSETHGDKLLVATGIAKLYVVDVSSPTAPAVTGPYSNKIAYDVTVRGEYAYVAHDMWGDDSEPVGFSVYGLSDLSAPIDSYQTGFPVVGVHAFE